MPLVVVDIDPRVTIHAIKESSAEPFVESGGNLCHSKPYHVPIDLQAKFPSRRMLRRIGAQFADGLNLPRGFDILNVSRVFLRDA